MGRYGAELTFLRPFLSFRSRVLEPDALRELIVTLMLPNMNRVRLQLLAKALRSRRYSFLVFAMAQSFRLVWAGVMVGTGAAGLCLAPVAALTGTFVGVALSGWWWDTRWIPWLPQRLAPTTEPVRCAVSSLIAIPTLFLSFSARVSSGPTCRLTLSSPPHCFAHPVRPVPFDASCFRVASGLPVRPNRTPAVRTAQTL